jgi:hypothetical protein
MGQFEDLRARATYMELPDACPDCDATMVMTKIDTRTWDLVVWHSSGCPHRHALEVEESN